MDPNLTVSKKQENTFNLKKLDLFIGALRDISYISPTGSFIYTISEKDLYLANLFFVAAHVGNETAFSYLLTHYSLPNHSAGIDYTDDLGNTLLDMACSGENIAIVSKVISASDKYPLSLVFKTKTFSSSSYAPLRLKPDPI